MKTNPIHSFPDSNMSPFARRTPPARNTTSYKRGIEEDLTLNVSNASHAPLTEFFLKKEAELYPSPPDTGQQDAAPHEAAGGDYGVRSLADAVGAALENVESLPRDKRASDAQAVDGTQGRYIKPDDGSDHGGSLKSEKRNDAQVVMSNAAGGDADATATATATAATTVATSPVRRVLRDFLGRYSYPSTPTHFDISLPTSTLPGSPKSVSVASMRSSTDDDGSGDDGSNVAIAFGGDKEEPADTGGVRDGESGSGIELPIPQFVMPSITIPRRRPFTENGRRLGSLKVLVAGDAGWFRRQMMSSFAMAKLFERYREDIAGQVGGQVLRGYSVR